MHEACTGTKRTYVACIRSVCWVLAAIKRSDQIFETLNPSETQVNVLGVYEHLLRFFQSYALTAIGEMKAAFEIQDHAFGLTPGNIVDASLMQMDRAIGLIKSGDQDEGCRIAAETVTGFSLKSRAELINRRAQEILQMVPSGTHSSRLREILD